MKDIDDVLDAATGNSAPISNVLMKCLRLASKLQNPEMKAWVNKELKGYGPAERLPDYRIHTTPFRPVGVVLSRGRLQANPYEEKPVYTHMREPIAQYEAGKSKAQIGVISGVRLRIVEELSSIQDALGEGTPGRHFGGDMSALSPQIGIQNNFYASNIAVGDRAKVYANTLHIVAGDKASLSNALQQAGLSDKDVLDLETSLRADGSYDIATIDPDNLGEATARWLARTAGKVTRGGVELGKEVGKEIIKEMIKHYFGLR